MRTSKAFAVSSLLSLSPLVTPAANAFAEEAATTPPLKRMRLEECVAAALERNVDVQTAGEEVAASEAARAGVRGQFGPRVQLDGTVNLWNSAYVVQNFPIRDAFLWNVTATITQPITPLVAIYDAYQVSELGVDIAAIKREATRRETAFRVVESYSRLLQAEGLVAVAVHSIEALDGQVRQAKSFHENGVVSMDDVLRAQLAAANAQQQLIQLRARVTVERSRLAVFMGMRPDAGIDAQPLPTDTPPPRDVVTLEQAEKTAELQRVELREVDRRIEQNEAHVRLAKMKLAPQINAVAAYVHNEGSLFNPLNSGYVGAAAVWNVWDWGTTTSGITQAKAHYNQAVLARTKVDDQIRLEVRKAYVDVGAASEAMTVAQASVASAEENFRLVKKRYDANAATSFSVVDAEGLRAQALAQLQTALYDFIVARAALRNAMGAAPEVLAHL
jgi:outer membrane protein